MCPGRESLHSVYSGPVHTPYFPPLHYPLYTVCTVSSGQLQLECRNSKIDTVMNT